MPTSFQLRSQLDWAKSTELGITVEFLNVTDSYDLDILVQFRANSGDTWDSTDKKTVSSGKEAGELFFVPDNLVVDHTHEVRAVAYEAGTTNVEKVEDIQNYSTTSAQVKSLYSDSDLPDPIAHWKLNDDTSDSVVTDSTNGYDGTLYNGDNDYTSENSVTGKINKAFTFDGSDDYVDLGLNDLAEKCNDPITFSGWIKTTSTSHMTLWGSYDGDDEGMHIDLNRGSALGETGKVFAWLNDDDDNTISGYTNDINFNDGNWHHLVVVWNGPENNIDIYLDNDEKVVTLQFNQTPDNFSTFDRSFYLGGINAGALSQAYTGDVDDVRLIEGGMDRYQVGTLYNGGSGTENTYENAVSLVGELIDNANYTNLDGYIEYRPEGGSWTSEKVVDEFGYEGIDPAKVDNNIIRHNANKEVTYDGTYVVDWEGGSPKNHLLQQPWDSKPDYKSDDTIQSKYIEIRDNENLHTDAGEHPYPMDEQEAVLGNSFTLFTVVKCPDASKRNGIWGQYRYNEAGSVFGEVHADSTEGKIRMWHTITDDDSEGGVVTYEGTEIGTTDYNIITWEKEGQHAMRVYINGTKVGEDTNITCTTSECYDVETLQKSFAIGALSESGGLSADVDYAYLTGYNRVLSETERTSIEQWLSERFGISISGGSGITIPQRFGKAITGLSDSTKYEFRARIYDVDSSSYVDDGRIWKVSGLGHNDRFTSPITLEDDNDSYYYESMNVDKDFSQIKNSVTVTSENTFETRSASDSDSISKYGEREYIEETELETGAALQDRANKIISRYSEPAKTIQFKTSKTGLRAGQLIRIKSTNRDIDDYFIIRSVSFQMDTQGTFVYDVEASTKRADELINYIKDL